MRFTVTTPMTGNYMELHKAECQSLQRQAKRGELNNQWDVEASSADDAVQQELDQAADEQREMRRSDITVHGCAKGGC